MERPPRTLQQVELPETPLVVTEHRAQAAWCPRCRRTHYAPLPPEVEKAGLAARLPEERRLNVDETGHKENGRGLWTWAFRADLYTLFRGGPQAG